MSVIEVKVKGCRRHMSAVTPRDQSHEAINLKIDGCKTHTSIEMYSQKTIVPKFLLDQHTSIC